MTLLGRRVDDFGTCQFRYKRGRVRYMAIMPMQLRYMQYSFGTQSVQQEYNFGTRLRNNKDAD